MIKNNWYVITGGPNSGKTTLIKLLNKAGYKVVHEAARILIDKELKKGKTLKEIRKKELKFQKKVTDIKIETEKKLSPDDLIFFDRGIQDTEAYYRLHNFKIDEKLQKACENSTYKKIFLLEPFEYKKDYARTETKEQQLEIHNLLKRAYEKTKISMDILPTMKEKTDRLKYVLKNL